MRHNITFLDIHDTGCMVIYIIQFDIPMVGNIMAIQDPDPSLVEGRITVPSINHLQRHLGTQAAARRPVEGGLAGEGGAQCFVDRHGG